MISCHLCHIYVLYHAKLQNIFTDYCRGKGYIWRKCEEEIPNAKNILYTEVYSQMQKYILL